MKSFLKLHQQISFDGELCTVSKIVSKDRIVITSPDGFEYDIHRTHIKEKEIKNPRRCAIRRKIEEIALLEGNICYIDNRANGVYRMKIVTSKVPDQETINQIKKLPHVIKVGYADQKRYSWAIGLTVHFDKKPSLIELH